jgi:hypothetical protein
LRPGTTLKEEEEVRGMFSIHKGIRYLGVIGILVALCLSYSSYFSTLEAKEKQGGDPSKLLVVWTSGDREVALKMVFMYTYYARKYGWWDEIRLLIWGPSSKLLADDAELQDSMKTMSELGVELLACKACSDLYGVSRKLEELGVDVQYMGVPFTEMLKTGWTTITF